MVDFGRRRRGFVSSSQDVSGRLWLAGLALWTAACAPTGETGVPGPDALVGRWTDFRVDAAVPAPTVPPRAELRFDGSGLPLAWRAVSGVDDLRVEDGVLTGRSTDVAPVLALDVETPLGDADELWSVVIRARASAGRNVGVHPMRPVGPPEPVAVARIDDWPLTSPLVAGEETKAYEVVLDRVFTLEMPVGTHGIETVLVRPTDVADAAFAIESVRLVFRKERLAGIASGPGWHGLGEIFREALVSRAPEVLEVEARIPDSTPWLDLAVGSVESTPPRFRVSVARSSRAGGDSAQEAAVFEPVEAERWHPARVDLTPWAGQDVTLRLEASGAPGALAFWGGPTIRASEVADTPRSVVVFLADTLRSDHLEAWGYARETAPTLTRLTREGVRFSDAVAQATWTKVSVSSILTSLYPSTSGVVDFNDRVAAGETTLAEAFRAAGYATFATSSVPFSGQLTNLHQGVEVMHEFGAGASSGQEFGSKSAARWVDLYLEWLDAHEGVPTFAVVHVMDPHSPFRPRAPYDTMWASPESAERFAAMAEQVTPHIESPLLRRFLAPSTEELRQAGVDAEGFVAHEKAWYDGSIRGMDAALARLVEHLETRGLTERALLAFVSDHGEEFLEHGHHWHGRTVYGEVANVPLAFWGDGVPAGVVVEETVQTIDLMPTLLSLAGLPIPERAQGRDLGPLFGPAPTDRSRPAFTEHWVSEPGEEHTALAMVDGDWKLVRHIDAPADVPEYELFRRTDRLDAEDVAAEHPEVVTRLAEALERWQSWAAEQRLDQDAVEASMSAEELEQLRSLGYID